MSRRLLYVMNIPSPYRWHLFTRLWELGQNYDIEFQVAFLADSSKHRPWSLDEFEHSFPFRTSWSINLSHYAGRLLNPGLVASIMREEWDWIILGGYDNPTNALLATLPLPRVGKKLIRNEGNLLKRSRLSGPIARMKRYILSQCDGYFIPGQRGMEWLDYWQPKRGPKPVHVFPNVIDDKKLVAAVAAYREQRRSIRNSLGVDQSRRLFLTPARLIAVKGLLEFLHALPETFGQSNTWVIAGDGPLRAQIEQIITQRDLSQGVKLLGEYHHQDMAKLYAAADVFVLPSLNDANPLSAIEAAFAGLPLLVSRRIGNYPELVIEGTTGWSFDPTNSSEVQSAINQAMTASDGQLAKMGEAVLKLANSIFQSDLVCHRLLDFLIDIHPDSKSALYSI